MTPEDNAHVKRILAWVNSALPAKYKKGKLEHGGHLWMKKGIGKMMGEEIIDFIVYYATREEQLEKYKCPGCGHPLELGEIEEQT
jgi:hypothetical protein